MKNKRTMSFSATTVLWIAVFCSGVYNSEAALKTFYVEELCYPFPNNNIKLHFYDTGILTSLSSEPDFKECTIHFRTVPGSSVVLSVYRLNLGPQDQLIVEDSQKFKVALLGEADFPDERKSFVSDGDMTLRYSRNGGSGNDNSSVVQTGSKLRFSLVFTQVHDGPCRFGEFECRNKKCISKKLLCDRHNHCGDNSDQERCGPRIEEPTIEEPEPRSEVKVSAYPRVWIISIIVSGVILVIIVVAFVAVLIRNAVRRKKEAKSRNAATVDATVPPQSPTAPPQSAIPQAPPASVFGRIRDSFRRNPRRNAAAAAAVPETAANEPENYQVPSMYPHIPSAPHLTGVDNPEFKADV